MEHQANVQELLEESKSLLAGIEQAYAEAKTAEAIIVIARPKVKSCLEHLRSSLDYISHDLSETTDQTKRPKKVYFPYGVDSTRFLESLNRNLPGLDAKYLFALESLQPHKCGNDWLIKLCKSTNINKHVRLQKQERVNSQESTTSIGNFIRMDGQSSITIGKLILNGQQANHKGPLVLTGAVSVSEIQDQLTIPVPILREYKWVKFVFEGTKCDVLELLKDSHQRIENFTTKVYTI